MGSLQTMHNNLKLISWTIIDRCKIKHVLGGCPTSRNHCSSIYYQYGCYWMRHDSDIWRRVSISSQECVQYFATFIDKYSTKARLYFVKTILIMFLHYLKNGINSHAWFCYSSKAYFFNKFAVVNIGADKFGCRDDEYFS